MITKYSLMVKKNVFIVFGLLDYTLILGISLRESSTKMKKEIVITVRVDSETDRIIRSLAKKDERTVAWTTRKLIREALEARKLLKSAKES